MKKLVSPSLLSADFSNLQREIEIVNNSSADFLHMDIMDGVFVPNISFGFPVLHAVKDICKKPFDVHCMIVSPEKYITQVAKTGAQIMSIHIEACTHLHRAIQEIHAAGMKAGVALNPATPISLLEDIIEDVDLVLLMSVNPGFGGQKFISSTLRKITQLRKMIDERCAEGAKPLIEIDGGVDNKNAALLYETGADMLVSGSYIFRHENPSVAIESLKCLL